MIPGANENPEDLWGHLLSRQPVRIRAAFNTLTNAEQNAVLTHLERMASENGWHKEQRASAHVALETIK